MSEQTPVRIELDAARAIADALDTLDSAAQGRILRWATARYEAKSRPQPLRPIDRLSITRETRS